jgi:hypothetical protein
MIDLDQQLTITQVRRQVGPRYSDWSTKFFQTIADVLPSKNAKAQWSKNAPGPNRKLVVEPKLASVLGA